MGRQLCRRVMEFNKELANSRLRTYGGFHGRYGRFRRGIRFTFLLGIVFGIPYSRFSIRIFRIMGMDAREAVILDRIVEVSFLTGYP